MQRSFSVVEDERWKPEKPSLLMNNNKHMSDSSDSEEHSNNTLNEVKLNTLGIKYDVHNPLEKSNIMTNPDPYPHLESAGPSNKKLLSVTAPMKSHSRTDSEESDEEHQREIPGEYDPTLYENLEIDDEGKELLQYIKKYTPQHLNLDYKFRPFIPEYIPAVGDIDAFLKVLPPERRVLGEKFNEISSELGLKVLDEPAASQSDPALLYLKLRAKTVIFDKKKGENVVVKRIENIEKNAKVIDKWIKDISDLHKTKSSSVVKYNENLPNLDDLMQEWPDELEDIMKKEGFPHPNENTSLFEYLKTVCESFQIPIAKQKIHSLHLLFCLYAAVKQIQLYQASTSKEKSNSFSVSSKNEADQLVLE